MKLMYSDPKTGLTAQMELDESQSAQLLNRRIGDVVEGAAFGLSGYKLKIKGGSDSSGFPLDRSIQGSQKLHVMRKVASSGKRKGEYKRMMIRGGMISADTIQVSAVITEYGSTPIETLMPKKEKKAPEEKKE